MPAPAVVSSNSGQENAFNIAPTEARRRRLNADQSSDRSSQRRKLSKHHPDSTPLPLRISKGDLPTTAGSFEPILTASPTHLATVSTASRVVHLSLSLLKWLEADKSLLEHSDSGPTVSETLLVEWQGSIRQADSIIKEEFIIRGLRK